MRDFSYSQALEFYKENYESCKKRDENLYFFVPFHTSKKIKSLLKNLFDDKLIQKTPNSPDIAYPIETIWAELKKE